VRLNAELFHLGQEAIANAIRHADPTRLVIGVAYQGDSMRLTIADNGRGFTMSGDLLGFGIRGMRKRASEVGGDLDISSVPGSGTTVSITVQLPKKNGLLALLNTAQTFVRTKREA
jgi:signal transduction histidine kinase